MSVELIASYGVMEGNGAYNKHAELQAGGAALALSHLEGAARSAILDPSDQPVVIADYGSSQGKNSLAPIRVAVRTLQARLDQRRPILVCHIDQPANDFTSLFGLLDSDPTSYNVGDPNIFPCAIGRSFYGPVLPPNSVHLGWSAYAVVWTSRVPRLAADHLFPPRSNEELRTAFRDQSAQDWEQFLALRSAELRPGGRLVVVLPAVDDNGTSGFESIMDHANAALVEMAGEGAITAEERARMVLGVWARQRHDILAPFERDAQFGQLTVEHYSTAVLADAAWADYLRDGNQEALATKHARFFRSTFAPSLACALDRSPERRCAFADRLEHRLSGRLVTKPEPLNSLVDTVVIAKRDVA